MRAPAGPSSSRSEEHTSELQSLRHLVCRLLLEKKPEPAQSALPLAVLPYRAAPPRVCRSAVAAGILEGEDGGALQGTLVERRLLFFLMLGRPRGFPLFPYTTLFRS